MYSSGTVKVTFLGNRGTVPVCGGDYNRYGQATACVAVEFGDRLVLLDGGTGILKGSRIWGSKHHIDILITHPHIDHLLGFSCFSPLFSSDNSIDVFAKTRYGMDVKHQIETFLSPPLWPVGPEDFAADVTFHDMENRFELGEITVTTAEMNHPGGCTALRLDGLGKSIVYATDFEPGNSCAELVALAEDCDLLICDAQYTQKDYPSHMGWGHSTPEFDIEIARKCGAKQLVFFHHDPHRTDCELDELGDICKKVFPYCSFAMAGEEIQL